jgi:hypothetical protein
MGTGFKAVASVDAILDADLDVDPDRAIQIYKSRTPKEKHIDDLKKCVRFWSQPENSSKPEGPMQLAKYKGQLADLGVTYDYVYVPRNPGKRKSA